MEIKLNTKQKYLKDCLNIHKENIKGCQKLIKEILEQMPEWYQCEYKIKEFIEKNNYTQSVACVINEYEKLKEHYYVSCTTEIIIKNNYQECKYLYENGYLNKKLELLEVK